jgi:hypothetical protein
VSQVCSHTDRIALTELPSAIPGCENWSWCYVDEVAFLVTTSGRERS